MRIAIDFDGTIVTHQYPSIGEPIDHALDVLKDLKQTGHTLILWTYRHGSTLQEAIDYCETNGIHFDAVNSNHANENYDPGQSRLIEADVFIDDRNLGGLPDWLKVREALA